MKRLAIGLAALATLSIAAVFILYSSMGRVITTAITTLGSEMVQAEVTLKETYINTDSGTGALRGLVVGNPEGFKSEFAFRMNEVKLALDWKAIDQEPVHIQEISIMAPEITYEWGPDGSNMEAIQRNVNAFVEKYREGSPSQKPGEGQKEAETKFIIDHVYIKGSQIHISTTTEGSQTATIPLSDIYLQDIGKKQNGATSGEVAQVIVDAWKSAILKAVLAMDMTSLKDSAAKVFEGTTQVLGETLQKSAEGVTEAMNDIFGKQEPAP